jgi:hypothetical protein
MVRSATVYARLVNWKPLLAILGLLPHDGKNIKFSELGDKIRETYNFAPSFCLFVPNYAATMLGKDFNKDTFDLQELDLHNGIEHDASLTRVSLFHLFSSDCH